MQKRVCLVCKNVFYRKWNCSPSAWGIKHRTCSVKCRSQRNGELSKKSWISKRVSFFKKCLICDKKIIYICTNRSLKTWNKRKYCSKKCVGLANRIRYTGTIKGSGKFVASNGYCIKADKNRKYKPEHRLVMEKIIGRKLRNKEVVHHINGIKSDNRPKNLIVFKSQKDHLAHHRINRQSQHQN